MTVYPFYFWFTPATPPPVVASTQPYIHHKSPPNMVYQDIIGRTTGVIITFGIIIRMKISVVINSLNI